MTHLSLINIDIVISIVRAIDNNPHSNNNNNMGESNNSKLSWNNKHTHIHPRRHAHTHTTHSTAIESQKKVAHAASSFTVKWQIAVSKQGKQRRTGGDSGVSQSSVPCRMWACLLRGRALAYWRTDRLPRVVTVAVVLFLVEWASYALSSPINRPFPLPIYTSPPRSVACYVPRVLLSAFFIVLVVVVTGAGSKVLRLLPVLDRTNMASSWLGIFWGRGRTVDKPIDFKFARSAEAKEAYKLVKKEDIAISRKYAGSWAL